jgi:hypothetical protein
MVKLLRLKLSVVNLDFAEPERLSPWPGVRPFAQPFAQHANVLEQILLRSLRL